MAVDVQIALRRNREVDHPMAGDLIEHVVEKRDAGGKLGAPVPSRFTSTLIEVSRVTRSMCAVRAVLLAAAFKGMVI